MVRHDTHYEPRFFKVVGLVGKSTISGQRVSSKGFLSSGSLLRFFFKT